MVTVSGIVTRPYRAPVESGLQSALNRCTVRPVLRPKCTGTERARTIVLFCSTLLLKPLVHEKFLACLILLDSICLIMLYKS
jgi:hypothetical protein